jgi:hypothetical protein
MFHVLMMSRYCVHTSGRETRILVFAPSNSSPLLSPPPSHMLQGFTSATLHESYGLSASFRRSSVSSMRTWSNFNSIRSSCRMVTSTHPLRLLLTAGNLEGGLTSSNAPFASPLIHDFLSRSTISIAD